DEFEAALDFVEDIEVEGGAAVDDARGEFSAVGFAGGFFARSVGGAGRVRTGRAFGVILGGLAHTGLSIRGILIGGALQVRAETWCPRSHRLFGSDCLNEWPTAPSAPLTFFLTPGRFAPTLSSCNYSTTPRRFLNNWPTRPAGRALRCGWLS